MTSAEAALIAATAAHLGFQVTVTILVYPALARVPAQQWPAAHQAHSRAITPIVGIVYGSLIVTGGWALGTSPRASTWVAITASAVAVLVTATAAAPLHNLLGRGHDHNLIRRLIRVDRWRTAAAAIAAVSALVTLW